MTDAHAALAAKAFRVKQKTSYGYHEESAVYLDDAKAALRETLAENERLTREMHSREVHHFEEEQLREQAEHALADANARIAQLRACVEEDASSALSQGAWRKVDRILSAPAADAHPEPCEWCPEPHRGFAEWRGDSKTHRSCGAEGHGINFEPSRPQENPEATREALAPTDKQVEVAAKILWIADQDDPEWAAAVVDEVFSPADDWPDEAINFGTVARAALSAAARVRAEGKDRITNHEVER